MADKIPVRVTVTYRGTVTVDMTRAEYEEACACADACGGASPDDFAWWDWPSLGVENLLDGEIDAIEEAPRKPRKARMTAGREE